MARWNTQTIIAGVNFSACKALILDGAKFRSEYRGSSVKAADGTPHVQRANIGRRGVSFGVSMEFAQASLLAQTLVAITAAEAVRATFRVQLTNALYTLDLACYPDYNQADWFTHGPESEGIIEGVVFRFESMGLYIP